MDSFDYLLFAFVAFIVFILIDFWLRLPPRGGRIHPLAWLIYIVIIIGGWFFVEAAEHHEERYVQRMIEGLAPTYAEELSRLGHAHVGLGTDPNDPTYLALIDAEKRWLKINPFVHDIYTLRKLPNGNTGLIVDSETDYDRNGRFEGERESRTPIGEEYSELDKGIEAAFRGEPTFDDEPMTDRWGTWVSATVPMYDSDGRIEAVLGVDFAAKEWRAIVQRGRMAAMGILTAILGVIAASVAVIENLRSYIRQREKMESEILRAKKAAEAASVAKGEFLANMSHEIRTPLNGVIGMVDLLRDTELSAHQKDFLEVLKESSSGLSSLLGDILDFSKIDAGKFTLDSVPFSVRECVEVAIKPLRYRTQSRGISVEARIDPSIPEMLTGDPARFRQIISNLVGNAVKFTSQGGVTVEAFCEIERSDSVRLRITVSDTGIGIPRHKLGNIFEPFTQSDSSITRRYGGTGLGLAIVSQLVKMMGGRIWVESEEGHGSQFHVTLTFSRPSPEDVAAKKGPAPLTQTPFKPLKILLAEDTPVNQIVTVTILEKGGHRVSVAKNGREVLDMLGKERFDLVLMDIQMPVMDGLETTKRIRDREISSGGTHIPIIAMTAHALAGDRQTALDAGMDDYLTKPIDRQKLLAAIGRYEGKMQTDQEEWSPKDLAERLGGDRDILKKIVDLFEEDRKRLQSEIRNAVDRKDASALEKAAHALRGSVGNFRYQDAFHEAGELERMGREGKIEGTDALIAKLDASLSRLSQLLQNL